MEFDDGNIMSVVLSCGAGGKRPAVSTSPSTTATAAMTVSDPPSFPPPPPTFSPPLPPPGPYMFPSLGGLEEVCMPFLYRCPPVQPRLQEQLPISSHSPESIAVEHTLRVLDVPKMSSSLSDIQKQQPESRNKKRKAQQPPPQKKKVTVQVPANYNDSWAWRKYGQKPIKGSPFPRAYYRCSSRKECPARKQVEKSQANPCMCNVTYSGDHDHALPTHALPAHCRSLFYAFARNRLPYYANPANPYAETSSYSSGLSPTTPLITTSPISADEEEEDVKDGALHVDHMEIAGADELLFLGDASNAPETPSTVNWGCFDVEDDPFFAHQLWNDNAGSWN